MTEERRLRTLESKRQRLKKSLTAPANVSKKKARLPGEIQAKKNIAVILRVANYDFPHIAASLNESVSTVKLWFNEPATKELYFVTLEAISEGAVTLLRTYTIEAIETIVNIMRDPGTDVKVALDAAKEILDRGGLPRVSKSEAHSINESKTTISDDNVVESLRELSPEEREKAAKMIEDLEAMVNGNG